MKSVVFLGRLEKGWGMVCERDRVGTALRPGDFFCYAAPSLATLHRIKDHTYKGPFRGYFVSFSPKRGGGAWNASATTLESSGDTIGYECYRKILPMSASLCKPSAHHWRYVFRILGTSSSKAQRQNCWFDQDIGWKAQKSLHMFSRKTPEILARHLAMTGLHQTLRLRIDRPFDHHPVGYKVMNGRLQHTLSAAQKTIIEDFVKNIPLKKGKKACVSHKPNGFQLSYQTHSHLWIVQPSQDPITLHEKLQWAKDYPQYADL